MFLKTAKQTPQRVIPQLSHWVKTPIREQFERLILSTKKVFKVPVVSIKLHNDRRVSLQSATGTEKLVSLQRLDLLEKDDNDDMVIIQDCLKDEGFKNNPLMMTAPLVRFYVNAPLFESNGRKIGHLILIDFHPHAFDSQDVEYLKDVIKLIESEINNYHISLAQRLMLEGIGEDDRGGLIDPQTQLWTFSGFKKILNYQVEESINNASSFGIALIHIELQNKKQTPSDIDVLQAASKEILSACRNHDSIARGDGTAFALLIDTEQRENILKVVQRMHENLTQLELMDDKCKPLKLKITIGTAIFDPQNDDAKMILDKAKKAYTTARK